MVPRIGRGIESDAGMSRDRCVLIHVDAVQSSAVFDPCTVEYDALFEARAFLHLCRAAYHRGCNPGVAHPCARVDLCGVKRRTQESRTGP